MAVSKKQIYKRIFGRWFRELREGLERTQGDIAEELGYSTPQFVSNWERGVSLPPLKDAVRVAKTVKVRATELLQVIRECEEAALSAKFKSALDKLKR